MERSAYLTQALQSLSAPPEQAQAPTMDPGAMGEAIKRRKAWEAANPGQSYMANGVKQVGQNLAAVPGNIAGIPGQLAAIPGNVMAGLGGMFRGQ